MALSTIQNNSFADTAVHGFRNLVINGAMQVWQRGTSFSGGSTYGYGVDRFMWAQATTNSRSTDVPANEGFTYSTAQQASSGNNILRHVIEDSQRLLGNNTFTLSFWVKGSTSGTGYVDVNDTQEQSYSITTSWQRITKTFTAVTGNANYGSDNDYIDWKTGVTATIYITGVQLEVGDVATPFEHRSYREEYLDCLRYYWQVTKSVAYENVINVAAYSTTAAYGTLYYPTPMRASPSFLKSTNSDFVATGYAANNTLDGFSGSERSQYSAQIYGSGTSNFTQGSAYWIRFNGDTPANQYFAFDAEL
jgi:ribosomal protein L27